jgi:hypothetical protein
MPKIFAGGMARSFGGSVSSPQREKIRRKIILWQTLLIVLPVAVILMGAMTVFNYMAVSWDFHDANLVPIANNNPNSINVIMAFVVIATVAFVAMMKMEPPLNYKRCYELLRLTLGALLLLFFNQGNIHVQAVMICLLFSVAMLSLLVSVVFNILGDNKGKTEEYINMINALGLKGPVTDSYLKAFIAYKIKMNEDIITRRPGAASGIDDGSIHVPLRSDFEEGDSNLGRTVDKSAYALPGDNSRMRTFSVETDD